jgi:uncharacterized protein (TIGR03435 family)
MKHLLTTALLLTAILFAPRLIAQATNTPSAAAPAVTAPEPTPPPIKFDVVLLKRCEAIDMVNKKTVTGGDSIGRHCQSMLALFDYVYGDSPHQVKGEPEWVDTDGYDFQAKVAPDDVPAWQKMDLSTRRLMVRAALADALNLKVHIETQSRPIYNLVVAKGGPNLTPSKPDPNIPTGTQTVAREQLSWVGPDEAAYQGATMAILVSALAARLDRNVVDKTGLTGTYDFHVKPLPPAHYDPRTSNVETTDFAAIIDGVRSLGLKLEPAKSEISVIVIDHIERPSEN